jgi:hypothetical protein
MICRSETGGSPPIHCPIMGSGVSLITCIPGTWMHPAMSIVHTRITGIMLTDTTIEMNPYEMFKLFFHEIKIYKNIY